MGNYTILKPDGTELCKIEENTLDTSVTSISLIGKGLTDYGESQNTNFVRLLANYASPIPPENPLRGQLWFRENESDGRVTSYFDVLVNNVDAEKGQAEPEWKLITVIDVSDDEPIAKTSGRLWYSPKTKALYVYDSEDNAWVASGVEDYLHVTVIHQEIMEGTATDGNLHTTPYIIPQDLIIRNLQSKVEEKNDKEGKGVLNEIEYSILAKEVYENNDTYTPKAMVFKGTAIVQTIKTASEGADVYRVEMLGGPIKNLMGRTDTANDWDVNISIKNGLNVQFDLTSRPTSISHVMWLVNLRITGV